MKKILFCSVVAICITANVYAKGKIAPATETLSQIKKNVAVRLEKCLLSPPEGVGNIYVNVGYGEAADRFLQAGNRYVNLNLSKADSKMLKEGIKKDQAFFKHQIQQCDEFKGESIPFAHALNWIAVCKVQRSREYMEYFYQPSAIEMKKEKKYNQSWKISVKEAVRNLVGN